MSQGSTASFWTRGSRRPAVSELLPERQLPCLSSCGLDAEAGRWTFLVSAGGPERVSALQFARAYCGPTWRRRREAPPASVFDSRTTLVENQMRRLGSAYLGGPGTAARGRRRRAQGQLQAGPRMPDCVRDLRNVVAVAELTGATAAASRVDLDQLAREVPALAKQRELTIVPALPVAGESTPLVALSPAEVPVDSFIHFAADAGSRLLYAHRRPFAVRHVGAFADLDEPDGDEPSAQAGARAALRRLRESARQHEDRTCELSLIFAAAGVLHRWTVRAAWYEDLRLAIRRAFTSRTPGAVANATGTGARPANTGRSWTTDEDADVARLFDEGSDVAAIAAELGRSTGAIRSRLRRLGRLDL